MYKLKTMTRQILIEKVLTKIKMLPEEKIKEVDNFADFLLNKIDDRIVTEGIQKIVSESKAFEFLNEEEELYSVNDLKEKYK